MSEAPAPCRNKAVGVIYILIFGSAISVLLVEAFKPGILMEMVSFIVRRY
jgi:hypothetical protein